MRSISWFTSGLALMTNARVSCVSWSRTPITVPQLIQLR